MFATAFRASTVKQYMGYDLHITRKSDWSDDDPQNEIPLEEWLAYVKSDPELDLNPNAHSYRKQGSDTIMSPPGFAEWKQHPLKLDHFWFSYKKGVIKTKNPDEATIRKMKQIAIQLQAIVQGDDGEVYDNFSDTIIQDYGQPEDTSSKKPWWKLW